MFESGILASPLSVGFFTFCAPHPLSLDLLALDLSFESEKTLSPELKLALSSFPPSLLSDSSSLSG